MPVNPDFLGFYCKIRDPQEIQLLRQVAADLGFPTNASLVHLLAKHYAMNNLERMQ
jgi:hypothetical protein